MTVKKLKLSSPLLPPHLKDIPVAPQQLYVIGSLDNFAERPRVAVVGSRKATPYGRAVTTKLVTELAEQGVIIISGLALGVDSIAHRAALDAGGTTIAVLACGLDRIYPASHTQLAREILAQEGALLSEYPEGTAPMQHQFIARNRIIAGLSNAVLIPEAAEKSGSLHTANFALEQGRTVLAVPGNITSATSAGTNNLIKAGALPVTAADDVLAALGLAKVKPRSILPATAEEAVILELLVAGTSDGAELLSSSNLDAATFNQTLTMLEITGKIRPLGAGHWTLA